MTATLNIKIASDVVCPWCAIGYAHLLQAMQELKGEVVADISWLPFELNPDIVPEGEHLGEHLAKKYGSTAADSEANRQRISDIGEQAGFAFHFSPDMRIYGTFDAHRLLRWALDSAGPEKQSALKQALFAAYFQRNENPGDPSVLRRAAEQAGLDGDAALVALDSDQYVEEVRGEEEQLRRMGVSSVPTFIINDQYAITGGQPAAVFVNALREIAQKQAS
ncbi:DsbA family oxidoreductase [Salinispirillum sp. LH 10-3-1]|uniref:DsbA family oxidoreductase n=1 Tax=Salinispirillum sp. LH 10-3-1 TaxID=2952525 RepID=A0AB38YD89_9GAMM